MAETIDFFPIQVEQTNWNSSAETLSAIRREVFIAEQQVPEDEEFDDDDAIGDHWIAWGENSTPMGVVRLIGNKIGRMAILKPYRRKGVGSSLLRAIIAFALREKLDELRLDAQLHAVGMYEDNGFTVCGNEFMDVGIAHVPMKMDLMRFTHRRPEPTPPDISDELRHRHQIDNIEEFRWSALQLAKHGDRIIRIFSEKLDPQAFDNDEFCQAIHTLVVNHPQSKVMILVKDTEGLRTHFHRLVDTFHKLSSHIELRRLTREVATSHQEFITGDVRSTLYLQNPQKYTGYLCLHSPLEVKHLNDEFDVLWSHSEPDSQLRQLNI